MNNASWSQWSQLYEESDATTSLLPQAAYPGSAGNGLRFSIPDGCTTYVDSATFGDQSYLGYTFWFRIVSVQQFTANRDSVGLLELYSSNCPASRLFLIRTAAGFVLHLSVVVGFGDEEFFTDTVPLEIGRWYCIGLNGEWLGNHSSANLYVDGQLRGSAYCAGNGADRKPRIIRVGAFEVYPYYEDPVPQIVFDIDEITVAAGYVDFQRLGESPLIHPGQRSVIRRITPY
jgi:hypothetical protein